MATSGTILRRMPVTVPTDGERQSSSGSGEKATLALSAPPIACRACLSRDHVNFIHALPTIVVPSSLRVILSPTALPISPPFPFLTLSFRLFLSRTVRLFSALNFPTAAGILECRFDTAVLAWNLVESVTWRACYLSREH